MWRSFAITEISFVLNFHYQNISINLHIAKISKIKIQKGKSVSQKKGRKKSTHLNFDRRNTSYM